MKCDMAGKFHKGLVELAREHPELCITSSGFQIDWISSAGGPVYRRIPSRSEKAERIDELQRKKYARKPSSETYEDATARIGEEFDQDARSVQDAISTTIQSS